MAGVVLVGVIAIAIFALGDQDKPKEDIPRTQEPAKTAEAPPRERSARNSGGRPGKKPDRPAPYLDEAALAKARAYLKEGKAIYNDAQRDRKSGKAVDHAKLQECKAVLDKGRRIFDEVTEWDEEATMEGWAYPARIDQYLKLWQKLTAIYTKAKRQSRAK